jgi:hypothetical protein
VTTVDPTTPDTAAGSAPWQDTTCTVEDRVEELLVWMTLKEKLAQLRSSRWVGDDLLRRTGPLREVGHDRRLDTPVELGASAGSADAE